jgi:hypothetical protein
MTRRALFITLVSVPGLSLCPRLAAAWNRWRERQRWERLLARAQARMRIRLKAQGLDLDRMTEDEVEAYVEQVIDENRQEQREKQTATHIKNPRRRGER